MNPEELRQERQAEEEGFPAGARMIRVRGCEYVTYFRRAIAHAGDCDNPIHKPTSTEG